MIYSSGIKEHDGHNAFNSFTENAEKQFQVGVP